MCDFPASKDFLVVKPLQVWKVIRQRRVWKTNRLWETAGPYTRTEIDHNSWMPAKDEFEDKDPTKYIGFRCFVYKSHAIGFAEISPSFKVRPVMVKGRCRIAEHDQGKLIIAEQIKFNKGEEE